MWTCICPGSGFALRSKIRTAFRIQVSEFARERIDQKLFFRVIYFMIVVCLPVVHVVHLFNYFENFIIKVFEEFICRH